MRGSTVYPVFCLIIHRFFFQNTFLINLIIRLLFVVVCRCVCIWCGDEYCFLCLATFTELLWNE